MTAMAIKHNTKHYTRGYMDLENLRQMVEVRRYRIKHLSTTYADSDVVPADSSLLTHEEANWARDQTPA